MKFRIFFLSMFLISASASAQHKGFSYELHNEIGTFKLVSLTVTLDPDNTEGTTYVINKQTLDTVYQFDQYFNGWVGLSSDGKTVAHLVSERDGKPLPKSEIAFYRDGKLFDKAELLRLIKYQLEKAKSLGRLSKKGWLKNDSVLHVMASNPFYLTEDKLFVSFDKPSLSVFDMNQMFHIYTGNGANHFTQNYYSIPNAPFRTQFDWGEYVPTGFPNLKNGKQTDAWIAKKLESEIAIPEMAKYRVHVRIKLKKDGRFELRDAGVYTITTNEKEEDRSHTLVHALEHVLFSADLLPPDHRAWIFETNFWIQ